LVLLTLLFVVVPCRIKLADTATFDRYLILDFQTFSESWSRSLIIPGLSVINRLEQTLEQIWEACKNSDLGGPSSEEHVKLPEKDSDPSIEGDVEFPAKDSTPGDKSASGVC
jgi:hypothetical protein